MKASLITGNKVRNIRLALDSGAAISLVAPQCIEEWGMNDRVRPTNKSLKGVGNRDLIISGEIDLEIEINGKKLHGTYIVSDIGFGFDILIGVDLLGSYKFEIKSKPWSVKLDNKWIPAEIGFTGSFNDTVSTAHNTSRLNTPGRGKKKFPGTREVYWKLPWTRYQIKNSPHPLQK